MYLINSIYLATEGEGIFLGVPQIFVRYQGCSIGCQNCDSKETWDYNLQTQMSLEAILAKIDRLTKKTVKRVSITGGDPLHPRFSSGLGELILSLKKSGYFINIEASGARVDSAMFEVVDYISFDIKTPSTGVETPINNILKMIDCLSSKTQLKSVVGSKKDFDYCHNLYEYLALKQPQIMNMPWCLTPEINPGESFKRENFIDLLRWGQESSSPFRVIGQQHKWIFGAEAKDV